MGCAAIFMYTTCVPQEQQSPNSLSTHVLKPNASTFSLSPVITNRLFISKHSAFLVSCPLGALHRPQVAALDMPKSLGFSSGDN